jgi:hypothetical protein
MASVIKVATSQAGMLPKRLENDAEESNTKVQASGPSSEESASLRERLEKLLHTQRGPQQNDDWDVPKKPFSIKPLSEADRIHNERLMIFLREKNNKSFSD